MAESGQSQAWASIRVRSERPATLGSVSLRPDRRTRIAVAGRVLRPLDR